MVRCHVIQMGAVFACCAMWIVAPTANGAASYSSTSRTATATVQTGTEPTNFTIVSDPLSNGNAGSFNVQSIAGPTTYGGSTRAEVDLTSTIDDTGITASGDFVGNVGSSSSDLAQGDVSLDATFTVDRPTPFSLLVSLTGGSPDQTFGVVDQQTGGYVLETGSTVLSHGELPANPTDAFPPPTTVFNDQGTLMPGNTYTFDFTAGLNVGDSAGETYPQFNVSLKITPLPPARGMGLMMLTILGGGGAIATRRSRAATVRFAAMR